MTAAEFSRTTLRQPWLTIARVTWFLLAVAVLAAFFLTQDFRYDQVSYLPEEEVRVLAQYGLTPEHHGQYHLFLEHVLEVVFVGVAFGLVWRKSDDWLVMAVSIYLLTPILGGATSSEPIANTLAQFAGLLGLLGLNLAFVFPDGRFVPGWTRYAAVFWSVWAIMRVTFPNLDPYNWPAPGIGQGGVGLLAILADLPFWGLVIYAQIYRYRFVSTPIQRQQTKWVVYGIILSIAVDLSFLPEGLFPVLGEPGLPHLIYRSIRILVLVFGRIALPITLAIAILRYRLWGIDIIINRSLVYTALTVSVVGIYVLIVGSLGRILQTSLVSPVIPFAATGVVAIVFQPMRDWFQRGVNRLMYGERDEPYRVLTRLGQQLEGILEPSAALPITVETVAHALKLPYVAIAMKDEGKIVAAYGDAKALSKNKLNTLAQKCSKSRLNLAVERINCSSYFWTDPNHSPLDSFPLIYSGETIGELLVASRAANEPLSQADRDLLNDLAKQISIAAHAAILSADLERARLRIVTAREEARRKLGSDLHDGVGHQLAGLTRKTETAANLLERDPSAAREMLNEVTGQLNNAITQVRSLAHQLHPPELELLGLTGALRERAQMQNGFMIYIDAPENFPALPTAIETTAYYIALETLTNIEKHANARTARIRLAFGDGNPSMLEMEIADDGRGLPPQPTRGLGMLSMQARAAEVGGTCKIESNVTGGTRVRVSLPISKE